MLDICRGKRSWPGSRGRAGKGRARAAGPVLAIAAAGLCLASPAAASAVQHPAAASAVQHPAAASAAPQPAGTALAWGDNTSGQLGNGTTGGSSSVPVPADLPAGVHVTAVSAGGDFSLALTSAGSVLAWGDNEDGQLGDGSTANSPAPVPVRLPAGTTVTAVAAGADYGLALTSAGSVLAWGDNAYGELGDGGRNSSMPVQVLIPRGVNVTAISAGGDYGLALTSAGSVLAWGWNVYGQLGDGATAPYSLTPVWVWLPTGVRVTAVSAGRLVSLALTSAGGVLAWGDNGYGELGDGELGNGGAGLVSPTPVAVRLPAGTTVTAVAAGGDYGLALTPAGSVLAWGDDAYGELGDGATAPYSLTPVAVRLPAGTRVTAVSAGTDYGLALTSAGSVLAWGENGHGELGNGTTANSPTPVPARLPAGTSVTAVSAGFDNSLAVAVPTSC